MNRILQLIMFSTALTLTAGVATDAYAKKKKGNNRIRNVGVKSFDDVFKEARTVNKKLVDGQQRRRKGRQEVNSVLGLTPRTAFPDALAELKSRADGKVQSAMQGNRSRLQASDAVPSTVQQALDSVNVAVDEYSILLTELAGLPDDSRRVAQKSKNLSLSQLRKEATGTSLFNISERIQQGRTFRNNIDVIGQLPQKSERLLNGLKSDVDAVTSVFPSR